MIDKINSVKQKLNRKLNSDAVSSTISLILVLIIFFSATSAVLVWGPHYIKSEENRQQIKATVNQYDYLVEALCSLTQDGPGSTSSSKIVINEGSIEIDSKGEKLIILYSNDEDWDFNVAGLDDSDSQFSVDMTNGQDVDSVTIYWLDDTCFLAGTKITMADGSQKNIEDIKAGDVVRSYDEASGSFVDVRVKKLLCYSKDRMSDYYLIINNKLRVTPNHRLFVNDNWVEAGELSVGDVLFDVSGEETSSIEKRFSKELSFDLLLESGNAYFADGFLARSDVEPVVVSGSVGVRKMSCAPFKFKPLGGVSGGGVVDGGGGDGGGGGGGDGGDVDSGSIPYTPSNPSPADGATNVGINADLSWTGGDLDGDTVYYDVYFEAGDSTPDIKVADDQTSTSFNLGTMSYSTHYYWKIVATDKDGGRYGPVWNFDTQEEDPGDDEDGGRTLYSSQDCYISQFLRANTGGCGEEWLRVDPGPAGTKNRALLKFPLYQIPVDAFIEKARLKLYYYQYLEGNPAGDAVFTNEVNDYDWKNGYTSWRYWDKSGLKAWPLNNGMYQHIRQAQYLGGTSTIAEATLPSGDGWVTWGDSSPKHGGMGMTESTRDLHDGTRVNYGWLISGHESGGNTDLFDFYSSRVPPLFPGVKPKLIVHYVDRPKGTLNDATNVGETTATLNGYLDDDGLRYATQATIRDGTRVTFSYINDNTPYTSSYIDVPVEGCHTGRVSTNLENLVPGDLYFVMALARNDAGTCTFFPETLWFNTFITVPPPPKNLRARPLSSGSSLHLSWDEATCGDDANVYTRVLAKTNGFPSGPEDPTAMKWYNGTGTSCTQGGLQSDTTYNIQAWTYVYEQPLLAEGRWSTRSDSTTGTTDSGSVDSFPTAVYTGVDADAGGPGTVINFDATGSSDDNGIVSYDWDWTDDGIYDAIGAGSTPTHDYGDCNSYSCKLRVTDTISQTNTVTHTVQATGCSGDNLPTAVYTGVDADAGGPGTVINFDATGSSDDNGIVSYDWDWEDDGIYDAIDAGSKPTHDYGDCLPHNCRLRVTDTIAQTNTVMHTVQATGCGGDSPPNSNPTVPSDFKVISNPTKIYKGIFYEFSVRSNDAEGDDIYYWFDWGDDEDDWWGPYPANIAIEASGITPPSHKWASSGVYEITVQAINDFNIDGDGDPTTNPGPVSDWSDPLAAIKVHHPYIVPPDNKIGEECVRIFPDSPGTFTIGQPLTSSFCIYLFSDDYPSVDDPAAGEVPPCVVYVLELGSIAHRIPSASGEYKTFLQNGGVMSVLPGGVNVDSYSNIYEDGNILGFTVTMIRGNTTISGSGAWTYGVSFENKYGPISRQHSYEVYNIKMKISGEYSSSWHEYLTRTYKFDYQSGSDFLVYDNYRGKQLIFLTALIKTNLA